MKTEELMKGLNDIVVLIDHVENSDENQTLACYEYIERVLNEHCPGVRIRFGGTLEEAFLEMKSSGE